MLPSGSAHLGEVYQWTLWAACEFEGPVDASAKLGMRMRPDWVAERLAVAESILGQQPNLTGEEFTLADLHVAAMLMRPAVPFDSVKMKHPNTSRWFDACAARPAFLRTDVMRRDGV